MRLPGSIHIIWIRGADHRRGGELTDSNMVGMSVGAVWSKGNHNIGFYPPDVRDNHGYCFVGWSLIQLAVDVIHEANFTDAQCLRGTPQFCFAHFFRGQPVPGCLSRPRTNLSRHG